MDNKTRAAIQQALDALESSKRSHYYCEDTWYSCPKHEEGCSNDAEGDECNCGADKENDILEKAITALREALAGDNMSPTEQAEQEPVAEIIGFERTNDIRGVKRIPRIKWNVPLWEDESPLQLGNLYAAPVRTKDLSDEEIWEAYRTVTIPVSTPKIARAVIAAYKEKNSA